MNSRGLLLATVLCVLLSVACTCFTGMSLGGPIPGGGSALGAHRGSGEELDGRALAATASQSGGIKSPYFYVNSTLTVANNTVTPGDFLALNGGAWTGPTLFDADSHDLCLSTDGGVFFVNLSSDEIIGNLNLQGSPSGLAFDPLDGTIYVANTASPLLAVINATSNDIVSTVDVHYFTDAVVYDSKDRTVFAAEYNVGEVAVVNTSTERVVANVSVGSDPMAEAYDPTRDVVLVANANSNNTTIIDGATDVALGTVAVGILPDAAIFDPDSGLFYVANYDSWNVTLVNDSLLRTQGEIHVGGGSASLSYDPISGTIYVGNWGRNNISLVNATRNTLFGTFPEGQNVTWVTSVAPSNQLIISIGGTGSLWVVNGTDNALLGKINTSSGPVSMVYDSGKQAIYLADNEIPSLDVIDSTTHLITERIPTTVGGYSGSLVYDSERGEIFAVNASGNQVLVINDSTNTVVRSISVGTEPEALAYDPAKGEVFVANWDSVNISVINDSTDTVVSSIGVPVYPYETTDVFFLSMDLGRGELFVSNEELNELDVVNATNNTIVHVVNLPAAPGELGYDPADGEVFVACGNNRVDVVNDTNDSLTASIQVGSLPNGFDFDSRGGYELVSVQYRSNLTVLDPRTNQVVALATVGGAPDGVAYDPASGEVYTPNTWQGTVSILDPGYYVAFHETGLPNGTIWSAQLGGTNITSSSSTIYLDAGNGSYSYTLGPVLGWMTNDSSGFVTVEGSNANVSVLWVPVQYPVWFIESGLPTGSTWWVNITGGASSNSTIPSVLLTAPHGLHNYTVGASNRTYRAPSGSFFVNYSSVNVSVAFSKLTWPITFQETSLPSGTEWWVNISGFPPQSSHGSTILYSLSNGSYNYQVSTSNKSFEAPGGAFTVAGAEVQVTVTFTLVTFSVSVTETGLPAGTEWWVNLTDGQSFSTTSTIRFSEANGTFTYTVATIAKSYSAPGGTFTVSGAAVSKTVTFSLVTYGVTFTESGLPSGTEWWANVSGQAPQNSTGTTIALKLPNGTYTYSVATSNKSYSSSGGLFTIDGAAVSKSVTFSLVSYSVTFTEYGLPSGTEWFLNLTGGASSGSVTDAITFNESNGTYLYTVATSDKKYAAVGGSFIVNGEAGPKSVTFVLVTYAVVFTETGLPSGTNWSVVVGGVTESFNSAVIAIQEPNGSYAFTVGSVSGYAVNRSGGTVQVNGAGTVEPLTFTSTSKGTTILGLPTAEGCTVVAGIVVAVIVAALAVAVFARRRKRTTTAVLPKPPSPPPTPPEG